MQALQPADPLPDLLAAHLADRDEPCPSCGYNLRGLRSLRCPECAQELVLRVNLREPRLAGFIAGLVGLAAGAGFSGLLLIYSILVLVWRNPGPPADWLAFFAITGPGLVVEGALLTLWIAYGRRIRRAEPFWRRLLVIGCWALTSINLTVFTMGIR